MEYIEGDSLSQAWMDLPQEDKANMANQVAEIMCTMRSKTAFSMIGGINPNDFTCPLVDDVISQMKGLGYVRDSATTLDR